MTIVEAIAIAITIVFLLVISRLSRDTHRLYKGPLSASTFIICSPTLDPEGCVFLTSWLLIFITSANFSNNGKYQS